MNNFQLILSQINETLLSLADWNNLSEFVTEFHDIWLNLANFVQQQKDWVGTQQKLLKKSQWCVVIKNAQSLKRKKQDLIEAIADLERYLTNNKSRIDYQSYLKAGLMIGSGVVESSNRRVVTQRLKQAGMQGVKNWSRRCYGTQSSLFK